MCCTENTVEMDYRDIWQIKAAVAQFGGQLREELGQLMEHTDLVHSAMSPLIQRTSRWSLLVQILRSASSV